MGHCSSPQQAWGLPAQQGFGAGSWRKWEQSELEGDYNNLCFSSHPALSQEFFESPVKPCFNKITEWFSLLIFFLSKFHYCQIGGLGVEKQRRRNSHTKSKQVKNENGLETPGNVPSVSKWNKDFVCKLRMLSNKKIKLKE